LTDDFGLENINTDQPYSLVVVPIYDKIVKAFIESTVDYEFVSQVRDANKAKQLSNLLDKKN